MLSEFQVGPVAGHNSNTWNHPLTVPSLPPSNLTNCSLIDLDYEIEVSICCKCWSCSTIFLKIVAEVSGFHMNLESKIPITIGTAPLVYGSEKLDASGDANATVPPTIGWVNPSGNF